MTPPPTVSIILPTFNRLEWLPATLASIFSQTLQSWELIVIDDGSDKDTLQYLQSIHAPPRIRVIFADHVGKPGVLRNFAIKSANAPIIAFMDSDDLWVPDKLAIQIRSLMQHAECSWGLTGFELVDSLGTLLRSMPAKGGWIFKDLITARLVVALPSVIVYRNFFDRVGGFDERLTMTEDYDLWLRMAELSPVDAIDGALTIIRRHGNHFTTPTTALQDSLRVLERYVNSPSGSVPVKTVGRLYDGYKAILAARYAAAGKKRAALSLLRSVRIRYLSSVWMMNAAKTLVFVCVSYRQVDTLRNTVHAIRRMRQHPRRRS